eukprot:100796-Chlamydomonas_euryale.AAC.1
MGGAQTLHPQAAQAATSRADQALNSRADQAQSSRAALSSRARYWLPATVACRTPAPVHCPHGGMPSQVWGRPPEVRWHAAVRVGACHCCWCGTAPMMQGGGIAGDKLHFPLLKAFNGPVSKPGGQLGSWGVAGHERRNH